MIKQSSK